MLGFIIIKISYVMNLIFFPPKDGHIENKCKSLMTSLCSFVFTEGDVLVQKLTGYSINLWVMITTDNMQYTRLSLSLTKIQIGF